MIDVEFRGGSWEFGPPLNAILPCTAGTRKASSKKASHEMRVRSALTG